MGSNTLRGASLYAFRDIRRKSEEIKSLDDLEKKLVEMGVVFDSPIDFLEEASWFSRIGYLGGRKKVSAQNGKPHLPTLSVNVEKVEYQIHGISHGVGSFLTPWSNLDRKVKKDIREKLSGFYRPNLGESCLTEQGLSRIFGLPKSQELKDHFLGKMGKYDVYIKNLKEISKRPKALLMLPLTFPLMMSIFSAGVVLESFLSYREAKRDVEGDSDSLECHSLKALKSLEGQRSLFDYLLGREWMQPVELEKNYAVELVRRKNFKTKGFRPENGGFVGHLGVSENVSVPVAERSQWTAKQLKEYAESNNLNKLHYLCGASHASEIIFFLQNPNYSLDKVKQKYGNLSQASGKN